MRLPFLLLLSFWGMVGICNAQNKETKRIKKECALIDSIKWASEEVVYFDDSLTQETAAMTIYKDKDGSIKKLDANYFMEMGRQLESFYMIKGNLIMATYQVYEYNRPYYWSDSIARDNGDSVSFDISKSFIVTFSYYFDQKKQDFIMRTEDKKGPTQEMLAPAGEATEIVNEFKKLKALIKK